MTWDSSKSIIRNDDGDPVPQIWDGSDWAVYTRDTIPEYMWLEGSTAPTPTEDYAWGFEFDPSDGSLTLHAWDHGDSAWVEVA